MEITVFDRAQLEASLGMLEAKRAMLDLQIKRLRVRLNPDDGLGYYRKEPEKPEPPSHEEIMTKRWLLDNGSELRAVAYNAPAEKYIVIQPDGTCLYLHANDFIGFRSSP